MKIEIKCFIVLAVAAMTSFCVSASDTKFQTGPFSGSVNLSGCDDLMEDNPILGVGDTTYPLVACNGDIIILLRGPNFSVHQGSQFPYDLGSQEKAYSTETVRKNLIQLGVDETDIKVSSLKINDKEGAFGSGFSKKAGTIVYNAGFFVSPESVCIINGFGDSYKMGNVINSIKVTEAAP